MELRRRLQVTTYLVAGALLVASSALLVTALAAKGPPGYWKLPDGVVVQRDIPYAEAGGQQQLLDVVIPPEPEPEPWPVVIFIHGGAWHAGDKSSSARFLLPLARAGYLGFSINYRLTQQGAFPAQIHDCKAAVRWVRAHAAEYGGDPERIAVMGQSAGGHLATLLGLSNGDDRLEGNIGENLAMSSEVQAVANWYGPGNLTYESGLLQPWQQGVMIELLGGLPEEVPEVARLASPIFHIGDADPPVLIIHGDADQTVDVQQSRELFAALDEAGVTVEYIEVEGGGHAQFKYTDPDQDELVQLMIEFLNVQLGHGG